MRSVRPLLWPALFTLLAMALLCSLGVWQFRRLAWKEGILTRIAERATATPRPLPPEASWPALAPDDYDYRHVELTGTFENDREALVFRGAPTGKMPGAGPGYLVLTPLRLPSGAHVIVNRGFVPQELADQHRRAAGLIAGPTTVSGLMRPPESRNAFTPADDPRAGRWFTRDPIAIAQAFGLADSAPFTVDADDRPVPGGWPLGGSTEMNIPNNHLSYALTWFGLAIGLVGVFAGFAWRTLARAPQNRRTKAVDGVSAGH